MKWHLGFTGTQEGLHAYQKRALRNTMQALRAQGFHTLHHGDCVGADAWAHKTWKELGGTVEIHPPIDHKKRAFCGLEGDDKLHPQKEYLERNQDIVDASERLIGCPRQLMEVLRSGTWSTMRRAREAHRQVIKIGPKGDVDAF